MNYIKREYERRVYTFDEVQKQKSSIVRYVLDILEDIAPDISDDDLNTVRKHLFKEIDVLHAFIQEER